MKSLLLGLVSVLILSLLVSCGGGKRTPPPTISVSISPISTNLDQGATLQLSATVSGTSSGVTWSIQEVAGGSITASGLYTAPATAAIYHIVATSIADRTKTAVASVVVPEVSLQTSLASVDMEPGVAQQLDVTVRGTVNTAVTWSVSEGAAAGNVSGTGLYTAPATAGTFHIVATSVWDPTKQLLIPISVSPLAVALHPGKAALQPGGTMTFHATVAGCMDDRVTWTVQEGTAGGIVTSDGVYTAPTAKGEYHLVAISMAHPLIVNVATIKVTDSAFTSVGSMIEPRNAHTATLLPNGDVLLTGGYYYVGGMSSNITSTAEIFDHVTKTFRSTGKMLSARMAHTATLLPSGKVLIAGGSTEDWWLDPVNSAELYDPTTETFSSAGTLVTPRHYHTATLLLNGKVLLAGGNTNAAEIYDPATGSFQSIASLHSFRTSHTATLLSTGKVLLLGGGAPPEMYAEIYDAATDSFTIGPSMTDSRDWQTATMLLNGNVLVAGGTSPNDWLPCTVENAVLFDVTANTFSLISAKPSECRVLHTATLLPDGMVLLAGGFNEMDELISSAELFDPATQGFIVIPPMGNARARHTATLLQDGSVLIAGGTNDTSAEVYKPTP